MVRAAAFAAAGLSDGIDPFRRAADRVSAAAGDLRSIGSGNIGATNVLRTGRKGLAALT
jgi:glycerol-3-phosphate acyltransferase PlsY